MANILVNLAVLKARKLTRSLEKEEEEEEPVEAMLVRVAKEIVAGYLETRMADDEEGGGERGGVNANQTTEGTRESQSSREEQVLFIPRKQVAYIFD